MLNLSEIKIPTDLDKLLEIREKINISFTVDDKTKNFIKEFLGLFNTKKISQNEYFYRARIHEYNQEQQYPPTQMGAPPAEKSKIGRAQPAGVSYLYTADSAETAIAEVKPFLGAHISIGKFSPKEELSLLNIIPRSVTIEDHKKSTGLQEVINQLNFSQRFYSRPFHPEDPKQYWDTIFVAQTIKNEGYDGFVFESLQKRGGWNFVFFEEEKLECLEVEEKEVKKINIESQDL